APSSWSTSSPGSRRRPARSGGHWRTRSSSGSARTTGPSSTRSPGRRWASTTSARSAPVTPPGTTTSPRSRRAADHSGPRLSALRDHPCVVRDPQVQHPPPLVFRELSQIARQRRGGQDQNGGTGTRDRRRQPTVPEPRHPLGGADERRCPVGLVQPVLGGGEQE